ncbi:MAG: MBL fold metallo-hydrolase RNA specificity domain-containing protein, partial [Pseudomonadota bacterium]
SRRLNKMKHGAIIIAGSGMCNGGRILHHLKHNVWRRETRVLIVGYQAYGSTGRKLVDGEEYIRIHGDPIKVAAQIDTVGGLSAHGDQNDLLDWYGKFRNKPPVYMVHGEKKAAAAFKERMQERFGAEVTLTEPGLKVDLREL